MLLRELYEADKAATLAFGRMNPPTIGHKKLVDVVASQPGDPFLFITQTQKPKTDPLDFQTKLKFAKRFFPNVTVGDSEVNTIIKALQKLESMGYNSITYVAGSDRVEDFKNLITKYNGKDYTFNNISVVSAGERDPDADGAEGMSASKMRAAAMSDDFDAFKKGVPDQSLANALYDAVRKGMGVTEKITKRTPMGDVVKDFYKSDAPQFKGKSKAKRRQMAIAAKLSKMDEMLAELKVTQQRPKIDVLTNIAVRKDSTPFPLSYKDTGDQTASSGGKLFIAPADAAKFVKFYDSRAEDEQELMQKALKSMHTANKLFHNLGIKVQVKEVVESQKNTHCSDKCCGSNVTREDCKCPPDCKHCNCNDDSIPEGDLVLDRSALIAHLQREIEKFAREEEDIEKLSYILKQLSGQKVRTRNKKYFTVSDEDIQESIRSAIKNLNESQLNEMAPAIAGAIWVIKWISLRGAWPVLKWFLKKYGGKIAFGAAAIAAIDQGWDWIKAAIGEEMAQLLIDNKLTIGMAVALVIGGVVIQKYFMKQGDKIINANEQLIANGY